LKVELLLLYRNTRNNLATASQHFEGKRLLFAYVFFDLDFEFEQATLRLLLHFSLRFLKS